MWYQSRSLSHAVLLDRGYFSLPRVFLMQLSMFWEQQLLSLQTQKQVAPPGQRGTNGEGGGIGRLLCPGTAPPGGPEQPSSPHHCTVCRHQQLSVPGAREPTSADTAVAQRLCPVTADVTDLLPPFLRGCLWEVIQ